MYFFLRNTSTRSIVTCRVIKSPQSGRKINMRLVYTIIISINPMVHTCTCLPWKRCKHNNIGFKIM